MSKRHIGLLGLCFAGALLNIATGRFFFVWLGIPLYMDTPFTIALTLYGGLPCGLITGALTNLIQHSLFFSSWADYLFTLCNIASALVSALFMRFFPQELDPMRMKRPFLSEDKAESACGTALGTTAMNTIIVLTMLSFALCLVLSIIGGLVGVIITVLLAQSEYDAGPELLFKAGLSRKHLSLAAIEIISRIPLNIIDRLIAAFAGYGIARLFQTITYRRTAHIR
jgi:hypothetical protein